MLLRDQIRNQRAINSTKTLYMKQDFLAKSFSCPTLSTVFTYLPFYIVFDDLFLSWSTRVQIHTQFSSRPREKYQKLGTRGHRALLEHSPAFKRQNSQTNWFQKSLTSLEYMLYVTSRYLSPVSIVSARDTWEHDPLQCAHTEKKGKKETHAFLESPCYM